MHEEKLNYWEDFEEKYLQLKNKTKTYPEHFLFRGQSEHKLKLETTLERACNGKHITLAEYDLLLKKQIATFKQQYDSCLLCKRRINWITCIDLPILRNIPGYNCMACLRQNGFPSPLLDWSQSADVAAYFAFNKAFDNQTEDVSIYMFLETVGIGKSFCHDQPHIRSMGHTIDTDHKHIKQRGEYTICVMQDGEWQFASHEDVFERQDEDQDCLWKFSIPVRERQKVLKILETRNVNANSLGFDS
ncbi:MAG: FRG domain-containing protein [Deltaproteobacteria bacterium]